MHRTFAEDLATVHGCCRGLVCRRCITYQVFFLFLELSASRLLCGNAVVGLAHADAIIMFAACACSKYLNAVHQTNPNPAKTRVVWGIFPPQSRIIIRAISLRVGAAGAQPTGWLIVDTLDVLGPLSTRRFSCATNKYQVQTIEQACFLCKIRLFRL